MADDIKKMWDDIGNSIDKAGQKLSNYTKGISTLKQMGVGGALTIGFGTMDLAGGLASGEKQIHQTVVDYSRDLRLMQIESNAAAKAMELTANKFAKQGGAIQRGLKWTSENIIKMDLVRDYNVAIDAMAKSTGRLATTLRGLATIGKGLAGGPIMGGFLAAYTIYNDAVMKWVESSEKLEKSTKETLSTLKAFSRDTKSLDMSGLSRMATQFTRSGGGTRQEFLSMMSSGASYGLSPAVISQVIQISRAMEGRGGDRGDLFTKYASHAAGIYGGKYSPQEARKQMMFEMLAAGPGRTWRGIGDRYDAYSEEMGGSLRRSWQQAWTARHADLSQMRRQGYYGPERTPRKGILDKVGEKLGGAYSATLDFALPGLEKVAMGSSMGIPGLSGMLPENALMKYFNFVGDSTSYQNISLGREMYNQARRGERGGGGALNRISGAINSLFSGNLNESAALLGGAKIAMTPIDQLKGMLSGSRMELQGQYGLGQKEEGKVNEKIMKAEKEAEAAQRRLGAVKLLEEGTIGGENIASTYKDLSGLLEKARKGEFKGKREEYESAKKDIEERVKALGEDGKALAQLMDFMANDPELTETIKSLLGKNKGDSAQVKDKLQEQADKAEKALAEIKESSKQILELQGIGKSALEAEPNKYLTVADESLREMEKQVILTEETQSKLQEESRQIREKVKIRGGRYEGKEAERLGQIRLELAKLMGETSGLSDTDMETYEELISQGKNKEAALLLETKGTPTAYVQRKGAISGSIREFQGLMRKEAPEEGSKNFAAMIPKLAYQGILSEKQVYELLGYEKEGEVGRQKQQYYLNKYMSEFKRKEAGREVEVMSVERRGGRRTGAILGREAAQMGVSLGSEAKYLSAEDDRIRQQAQNIVSIRKDALEREVDFTVRYTQARMRVIEEHYNTAIQKERLGFEARDRQIGPQLRYGQEVYGIAQQAGSAFMGQFQGEDYWRQINRQRESMSLGFAGVELPREVQMLRQQQDFQRQIARQGMSDRLETGAVHGTLGALGTQGIGMQDLMGTEGGVGLLLSMMQRSQGAFSRQGQNVFPMIMGLLQKQMTFAGEKLGLETRERGYRTESYQKQIEEMEGGLGGLKGTARTQALASLGGKYAEAKEYYASIGDTANYNKMAAKYEEILKQQPDLLQKIHQTEKDIMNEQLNTQKGILNALTTGKSNLPGLGVPGALPGGGGTEGGGWVPGSEGIPLPGSQGDMFMAGGPGFNVAPTSQWATGPTPEIETVSPSDFNIDGFMERILGPAINLGVPTSGASGITASPDYSPRSEQGTISPQTDTVRTQAEAAQKQAEAAEKMLQAANTPIKVMVNGKLVMNSGAGGYLG